MAYRTISISEENYNKLKQYKEGSFNSLIGKLLDVADTDFKTDREIEQRLNDVIERLNKLEEFIKQHSGEQFE